MFARAVSITTRVNPVRARMVACRYMASSTPKAPPTPKTPPTTTTQQKSQPAATPKSPPPQQMEIKTGADPKRGGAGAGAGGKLSKSDYEAMRLALPVRFYNKSGRLASELFVNAERASKDELQKTHDALNKFGEFMRKNRTVESFIVNPTRPAEDKKQYLAKIAKKMGITPTLSSFMDTLWRKDIKYINKIIADFDTLYMARNKTVNVTVTIAEEKQPKPTEDQVKSKLGYSADTKVTMNFVVDPSIEGGAVLRTKDRLVDCSFVKSIREFKEKLAQKDSTPGDAARMEAMNEIKKMRDSISI